MNDQVFDLKEFLERVQDDKELLLELLDIFVEDYKAKYKQLQEAINNKNIEEIKSIAHSLKGSSGNISAKLLRTTCLKLEELGKNNDLAQAKEYLIQMDQQFKDLLVCIDTTKAQLKS